MKKSKLFGRTIIFLQAAVIAICIAVFSCDGLFPGLPVSITGRIGLFEDDLNIMDRSVLYKHFHSTETVSYTNIKAQDFFNASPLSNANIPFTISIPGTPLDQGNGRMLVTGTLSHKFADNLNIQFIMLQNGEDWFIEELSLPDVPPNPWEIKKLSY